MELLQASEVAILLLQALTSASQLFRQGAAQVPDHDEPEEVQRQVVEDLGDQKLRPRQPVKERDLIGGTVVLQIHDGPIEDAGDRGRRQSALTGQQRTGGGN